MDKRSAESPMDFEWQTRAPGDATSPFYQLSMQHDNQKKRPHTTLNSPEKKQMPALRDPHSQPFFFSNPRPQQAPATPKPAPFNQAAFTTPRKFDLDFSSGAENFSSPEHADNEDTPEQPMKTGHRDSLSQMYGRFAPSPGRGEIPRLNHYSHAMARRVQKRRIRDKTLSQQLRREESDVEDDEDSHRGRELVQPMKQRQQLEKGQEKSPLKSGPSSFGEFFTWLEEHPHMPNILSWWAQLVVNLSLFSLAVYVVFAFVNAIRVEFDQAAEEASDTILADMAVCAKSYVDNKCAGSGRLPALESVCENWERCMNRDPAKVGRAKVSAHTMAIIINSFIDPISWKAIMFFLATISTVTVVSNWSFRSFRSRLNQQEHAHSAANFSQQPSGERHPSIASSQAPFQHDSGFGYQNRALSFEHKQQAPLMLEHSQARGFMSDRNRDREIQPRTPSPVKRGMRFA